MKRHTKLVPHVHCPQCGRGMYQLSVTRQHILYGCTAGHIHKEPRPAEPKSVA